jgi:LPXTG-motif cell wall-anchored protein
MMRVFLAAGCAGAHESHIEIDVASTLVLFMFVDADATGGFDATVHHLPASALPGPHEVVVKTVEHTYRAPITVQPSSGRGSVGVGGGGGSSMLGGSVRRRPLPHTGEEIARLLSLALGLVFAGAGLRLATRARRRAREPAA